MDGILTGFSGMMRGRAISVTDATHITGTIAQVAMSTTSGLTIVRRGVSFSINTTTVGAGGRSTATAIQASTVYYIHVIDDGGSNTSAILDTSATSPTLPSGYVYSYMVGAVNTSTGSNGLIAVVINGKKTQYKVGGVNCATPPIIGTGVTGNVTTPTWTAAQVTGNGYVLPTIATHILGWATASNSAATITAAPNNSYGGVNSTTNAAPVFAYQYNTCPFIFQLESNSIYWASNGTNCRIYCLGWEDDL